MTFPREDDLARTVLLLSSPAAAALSSCQSANLEVEAMAPVSNPDKDLDGPDGGECSKRVQFWRPEEGFIGATRGEGG